MLSLSMQKLLTVLKTIKKVAENQAAKEKACPAKQENKTDFEKSGKQKGMRSSTNRIPKKMKSSSDHFCQLCKGHGGPHTTHNTKDCYEYEKDGSKKKFGLVDTKSTGKTGNLFAQLTDKLSKSTKKASWTRHCCDDSNNSDSDNE